MGRVNTPGRVASSSQGRMWAFVWYLPQGYLWHSPLPPEHLPYFVYSGTWTRNPPLLSYYCPRIVFKNHKAARKKKTPFLQLHRTFIPFFPLCWSSESRSSAPCPLWCALRQKTWKSKDALPWLHEWAVWQMEPVPRFQTEQRSLLWPAPEFRVQFHPLQNEADYHRKRTLVRLKWTEENTLIRWSKYVVSIYQIPWASCDLQSSSHFESTSSCLISYSRWTTLTGIFSDSIYLVPLSQPWQMPLWLACFWQGVADPRGNYSAVSFTKVNLLC